MKKLALALVASATLAGQAMAADMAVKAARPAPAPIAVANWTGCYISGGGGYGLWNQETTQFDDTVVPRTRLLDGYTIGGRGWFGTAQGGCDYQFGIGSWQVVVGAFGDYDFADMSGTFVQPIGNRTGGEKLSSSWAAGGRIGVLITPQLLTYFSGGYTESKFDQINLHGLNAVADQYLPGRTYTGWFLGSGYEYALGFLPGLYWKTEYRFAELDTERLVARNLIVNTLTGDSWDSRKYVHTVRSQLVWRFNFGGAPLVAKY